jgi:hypothetical protein
VRFDLCAVLVEVIDVELLQARSLLMFSHVGLLLLMLDFAAAAADFAARVTREPSKC